MQFEKLKFAPKKIDGWNNKYDECDEYLFVDGRRPDKRGRQAEAILSKRMTEVSAQKKKKDSNKITHKKNVHKKRHQRSRCM